MANNSNKKPTPKYAYVIVIIMFAVFIIQMIFPDNLGKVFDENSVNAVEITVTRTSKEAGESRSYYTASRTDIENFSKWAAGKSMRHISMADGINVDDKLVQYSFAIKDSQGVFTAIMINAKKQVRVGAVLYKVSGSTEQFIQELESQLESWEGKSSVPAA